MKTISVGDLVIDNFGREGIVYSKERRPSAKWLLEQEDIRVKQSPGPWWKVLPLTGGAVIVPTELSTIVRRANIDDLHKLFLAQLSEHASTVTLLELFRTLSTQSESRTDQHV